MSLHFVSTFKSLFILSFALIIFIIIIMKMETHEKIITIIIQKHPVIHLHTIPIIIRIIVLKLLFFSLIFFFSCSQLYYHHQTLRNDLASSLFKPGSDQTARLKAVIHRQDTIILTGGRWKQNVMDWLQQKGF